MVKRIFLSFLIVFSSHFLYAQTTEISGTIRDTIAGESVKNAVVALLNPADSLLVKFTRTKANGSYTLQNVAPGTYTMLVMHPTFADYVEDIILNNDQLKLPAIALTPKSKLLEAVILKSGSPIRIKGDTTIYTADSFNVSANANVEELLKKLPGIQVDKNGQIKAMGQTVEKVLVDGEEFFGDDPGMAVKNLRADAVKEVQVFDKKSEQAEFTGIDDGNTQKTINLKLKENKKTGYFGKIDAAGGLRKDIDDRYNTNLMYSTFKGKRKLSGFLLNGNTGQDGLSWQDNEKFGGTDDMTINIDEEGGGIYMFKGGSSDDEPYINPENGYITNTNAGIQYSNKWNDKHTFNFSPKYNGQDYHNRRDAFTQSRIGDSILNDNSVTNSDINRYNIKTTAVYDAKLDSNNSLKLTLKANFYHTENEEIRTGETRGGTGTLKNSSTRNLQSITDKSSYSANVIFKHRFKKLRRTLSLTADWNLLSSDGESFLNSDNLTYINGEPSFLVQQDQFRINERSSGKLASKITYTEPLSKKTSVEIAYELSYLSGVNDQLTYSYSPVSGKYDVTVDSLSNDFEQLVIINKPSVRFNYSSKKLKINVGSGFGITDFSLEDKTYNNNIDRDFTNFFPSAGLTYTYKSNHNLRFNYNGNTTQPTVNQLQPLRNNNDYFNQYIGNPDLKPTFNHNFNISHNSYDFLKDRWVYQSVNVRVLENSITNNRMINLDSGKTTIQPINTDGNVMINVWTGTGFKIKKIDTRFNINPNLNYNRFIEVINSTRSYSKNLNAGLSLGLSKSKDKKYDISLNNNFAFNSNVNSQNDSRIHYNTNDLNLSAKVYIKKVWSVSSDYNFFWRQKTPQFNSQLNNHNWDARLERTFKKDEFTAYVMVRDILNQNIGIERSFYGNTLSEIRNDRLKRYWLVGFTWNFKNK